MSRRAVVNSTWRSRRRPASRSRLRIQVCEFASVGRSRTGFGRRYVGRPTLPLAHFYSSGQRPCVHDTPSPTRGNRKPVFDSRPAGRPTGHNQRSPARPIRGASPGRVAGTAHRREPSAVGEHKSSECKVTCRPATERDCVIDFLDEKSRRCRRLGDMRLKPGFHYPS